MSWQGVGGAGVMAGVGGAGVMAGVGGAGVMARGGRGRGHGKGWK